ncbi:MAG: hypothetical protein GC166_05145 [Alphaproteobacteria bacterium]|nr:hypothetical protein [Alphaproteobacteria bacterium]
MKSSLRYALLGGAVILAASGAAIAKMEPGRTGPEGNRHSSYSQRLLSEFDMNKDGKITRAELDKVSAQRFAQLSDGKNVISKARYEGAQSAERQRKVIANFHRVDWNGDDKVTLAEYATPLHAQFQRADREALGSISCTKPAPRKMEGPRSKTRISHRGGSSLCRDGDLNKDGILTRAEFDKAIAGKFASVAKGGGYLSAAMFAQIDGRSRGKHSFNSFARMDANSDGNLNPSEFASRDIKMFVRLDKNNDGVLTANELVSSRTRDRGKRDHG